MDRRVLVGLLGVMVLNACSDASLDGLDVPDSASLDAHSPGDSKADASPGDLPGVPDRQEADQYSGKACGPAQATYNGALCGPSSKPCKVLIHENIPVKYNPLRVSPALALDATGQPRVLFSLTSYTISFPGNQGVRTAAGKWTVTDTPFKAASIDLVREPGGSMLALSYDGGGNGNQLWRHSGKGWNKVQDVTPALVGFSRGYSSSNMAVDSVGCLHLTMRNFSYSNKYIQRTPGGKWQAKKIYLPGGGFLLALNSSGLAHLVGGTQSFFPGGTSMFTWHVPGMDMVEQLHTTSEAYGGNGGAGMAVVGSGLGTPHVLWSRSLTGKRRMVHARRQGGAWKSVVMATDKNGPGCGACKVGATCKYDYNKRHNPLAVVASGSGDVRLLYARTHHQGTQVGKDVGGTCTWTVQDTRTDHLEMAWPIPNSAKYGKAVLVSGLYAWNEFSILPRLDSKGNMHAAFYVSWPNGPQIRYLKIGP